ncbi:hypothetical protein B0H65DRAFT_452265 [Neurospora tetraspora]|uniref:Uncharacterized protein n=1 Tax=Neurospora tetraspora TaxID=94610 RepID=A0AAE0JPV7_9PEZI|nr:hypothetical protein B0H65DRAFT_452265 [Neurospora tetraspora]
MVTSVGSQIRGSVHGEGAQTCRHLGLHHALSLHSQVSTSSSAAEREHRAQAEGANTLRKIGAKTKCKRPTIREVTGGEENAVYEENDDARSTRQGSRHRGAASPTRCATGARNRAQGCSPGRPHCTGGKQRRPQGARRWRRSQCRQRSRALRDCSGREGNRQNGKDEGDGVLDGGFNIRSQSRILLTSYSRTARAYIYEGDKS